MQKFKFVNQGINIFVMMEGVKIASFNKQRGVYRLKEGNGQYQPTQAQTFEQCKDLYLRIQKPVKTAEKVVIKTKQQAQRGQYNPYKRIRGTWGDQKRVESNYKRPNVGLKVERDGNMYAGGRPPKA